jgi:hypothetical protein
MHFAAIDIYIYICICMHFLFWSFSGLAAGIAMGGETALCIPWGP